MLIETTAFLSFLSNHGSWHWARCNWIPFHGLLHNFIIHRQDGRDEKCSLERESVHSSQRVRNWNFSVDLLHAYSNETRQTRSPSFSFFNLRTPTMKFICITGIHTASCRPISSEQIVRRADHYLCHFDRRDENGRNLCPSLLSWVFTVGPVENRWSRWDRFLIASRLYNTRDK